MMTKNPRVENPQSIQGFLNKHQYSTTNSFLLQSDSDQVYKNLLLPILANYYVFNKYGELLCFNGNESCSGTQFRYLNTNYKDSFAVCKNDSIHLGIIIKSLVNLQLEPLDVSQIPKSDYYIVTYWSKFLGNKRGYEDGVAWMEEEIKNSSAEYTITLLKVNTDLREDWGMKPKGKARLKFNVKDEKLEIKLDKIPYK